MSDGRNSLELSVGKQIRARRLSKGISLSQLAAAGGCSAQEIEQYEMGRKRLPPDRLWDFAQKLNVPLSYFFCELGQQRDTPRWGNETKMTSVMRSG